MEVANETNRSAPDATTAPTAPYSVTTEMWILYVVFYIVLGVAAIVENIVIAALIATKKKLRTFFFTLIAGHCLGQMVFAFGNIVVAVYRLLPVWIPSAIRITRLQCHGINILVYFAPSFSAITMLILAADRSYAIGKPLSYQQRSLKQGLIVMITAFLFTLMIKVVPSYTGSDIPFLSTVTCMTARNAVTPQWWAYNYYINCTLVFSGVILYSILMIFALIRAKELKNGTFSNDDLSNRLLQRQLKLLNAIRSLIIINVSTVVPFTILLILSNYYEPSTAARLVVYGASMNAIDMAAEPIFLVASSAEMKRSLLSAVGFTPNTVAVNTVSITAKL